MQAVAARNGKYDIVRQAGMDLIKIYHDLENEKHPQPMTQEPASPLDYQQFPSKSLRSSHSHLSQESASPLDSHQLFSQPLTLSILAPKPASPLNYWQFPPNPLSSPFHLAQKPAAPLNYWQFPPNPLSSPFHLAQNPASQLNSQHLSPNPFGPSPLAQEPASPLDYQQFSSSPISSPVTLALKCAPTPQRVQNPALKCARPFLNGFKMRAACAPRCANFLQNPISSPKIRKITPCQGENRRAVDPMERRPGNVPKILNIAPLSGQKKNSAIYFPLHFFHISRPYIMETAFFLFA